MTSELRQRTGDRGAKAPGRNKACRGEPKAPSTGSWSPLCCLWVSPSQMHGGSLGDGGGESHTPTPTPRTGSGPLGGRAVQWPPFPAVASRVSICAKSWRAAFVCAGVPGLLPSGPGVGLHWASDQDPALPPPHPGLPAPAPPRWGQQARMLLGAVFSEDRPLAGVWTVTEAAASPGVGWLILGRPRQVPALPPLFRWGH